MKTSALSALLLTLTAAVGCAPEFEPASRVVSLRVLAQVADLPFAQPGETVQIQSLSHAVDGETIDWAWTACVNPAASTVQGCLDQLAETSRVTGTAPILAQGPDLSQFSYTVPSDAFTSLPAVAQSTAFVGVLSVACPGDVRAEPGPNHLPWNCKERGSGRTLELSEYVIGMKRIMVRHSDRNSNPVIEQVTFDGEDWPADELKEVTACDTESNDYKPCSEVSKHQIAARPSAASVQSGTTEFGRAFQEQVVIEYYATEGIFEHEIKIAADPVTGWAARKAASGQDLTLWMVVHDDRGGATWAERHVHVQ